MKKSLLFILITSFINSLVFGQFHHTTIETNSIAPYDYGSSNYFIKNISIKPHASVFVSEDESNLGFDALISFYFVNDNDDLQDGSWMLVTDMNGSVRESSLIELNTMLGVNHPCSLSMCDRSFKINAVKSMGGGVLIFTGSLKASVGGAEYLTAGTIDISTSSFTMKYYHGINELEGIDLDVLDNDNEYVIAGNRKNWGGYPFYSLVVMNFNPQTLSFSNVKEYQINFKVTDVLAVNNNIDNYYVAGATIGYPVPASEEECHVIDQNGKGVRVLEFDNGLNLLEDMPLSSDYFYDKSGNDYGGIEENYCHIEYSPQINRVLAITDILSRPNIQGYNFDVESLGLMTLEPGNLSNFDLKTIANNGELELLTDGKIVKLKENEDEFAIGVKMLDETQSIIEKKRGLAFFLFQASDLYGVNQFNVNILYDGYYKINTPAISTLPFEGYGDFAFTNYNNNVFASISSKRSITDNYNYVFINKVDKFKVVSAGNGDFGNTCPRRINWIAFDACIDILDVEKDMSGTSLSSHSSEFTVTKRQIFGSEYNCNGTSLDPFRKKVLNGCLAKDSLIIKSNVTDRLVSLIIVGDKKDEKLFHEVKVFDSIGKLCYTKSIRKNEFIELDLISLNHGVHFVVVESADRVLSEKILKI